ncbi:hypothetical protein ACFQV2_30660 [Actinokineospora soli]|uniref:Uncharacterized protein n=1 Tax=Actinokineospora soli TaxID=1048753 RepID=A0ABW2TWF8_9PSEU
MNTCSAHTQVAIRIAEWTAVRGAPEAMAGSVPMMHRVVVEHGHRRAVDRGAPG